MKLVPLTESQYFSKKLFVTKYMTVLRSDFNRRRASAASFILDTVLSCCPPHADTTVWYYKVAYVRIIAIMVSNTCWVLVSRSTPKSTGLSENLMQFTVAFKLHLCILHHFLGSMLLTPVCSHGYCCWLSGWQVVLFTAKVPLVQEKEATPLQRMSVDTNLQDLLMRSVPQVLSNQCTVKGGGG